MAAGSVLARFRSDPARTNEECDELLSALLQTHTQSDGRWAAITKEFCTLSAQSKSREWCKRRSMKLDSSRPVPIVAAASSESVSSCPKSQDQQGDKPFEVLTFAKTFHRPWKKYYGSIRGNMPHGHGLLVFTDDGVHVGEFRNGDALGYGLHYYPAAHSVAGPEAHTMVIGTWKKNKPDGPSFTLSPTHTVLAVYADGSAYGLGLESGEARSFDSRPPVPTDKMPDAFGMCKSVKWSCDRSLELVWKIRDEWPEDVNEVFPVACIFQALQRLTRIEREAERLQSKHSTETPRSEDEDLVDPPWADDIRSVLTSAIHKPENIAPPEFYHQEGNRLFKMSTEGALISAVEMYTKALRISPPADFELRSILYTNRAMAQNRLTNKDMAANDALVALFLNPGSMKAVHWATRIHLDLGLPQEASFALRHVLEHGVINEDNIAYLGDDCNKTPPRLGKGMDKFALKETHLHDDIRKIYFRENTFGHFHAFFMGEPTLITEVKAKAAYKMACKKLDSDGAIDSLYKRQYEEFVRDLRSAMSNEVPCKPSRMWPMLERHCADSDWHWWQQEMIKEGQKPGAWTAPALCRSWSHTPVMLRRWAMEEAIFMLELAHGMTPPGLTASVEIDVEAMCIGGSFLELVTRVIQGEENESTAYGVVKTAIIRLVGDSKAPKLLRFLRRSRSEFLTSFCWFTIVGVCGHAEWPQCCKPVRRAPLSSLRGGVDPDSSRSTFFSRIKDEALQRYHDLSQKWVAVCVHCSRVAGPDEKFRKCSRCFTKCNRSIRYCGAECQQADWSNHRVVCGQVVELTPT